MPFKPSEKPIKIVLDTNNLVSSIINKKGACFQIFNLLKKDRVIVFTSPFQLNELKRVLNYPRIQKKYRLTPAKIKRIVTVIEHLTFKVYPAYIPAAIIPDPDDNQILAIAKEARADFIISGDEHLLDFKRWEQIPIISARRFLDSFASSR